MLFRLRNFLNPSKYFSEKIKNGILNLFKKLLGKIPGGKSRIASYAAALFLIKEESDNPNSDKEESLIECLKCGNFFSASYKEKCPECEKRK